MLKSNALIDSILGLSPKNELWESKPVGEMPDIVKVNFGTGKFGLLDLKNPRTLHWANVITRLLKAGRPVYVEIDDETNVIIRLLIPRIFKVESITADDKGDLRINLMPSHAIHYLLKSNPDFNNLRGLLETALNEKTEVLITETRDELEIIDVRQVENASGAPQGPAPDPNADPPVTETRAQDLFNEMKSYSCVPCNPSNTCIPFLFPEDGCWARAHKMCSIMVAEGEDPEKVWIQGGLTVQTANSPYCHVGWGWHVAPTLMVITSAGNEKRVIDPSLFDTPVTVDVWKSVQGDPGASLTYTPWTDYFWGSPDPDLSLTESVLADYRDDLKDRCEEYGPPPYSCVKDCYFILDRNTFSKSEIDAMLHLASPAQIDDAFYIVVDGFSPYDLGIYSAAMSVSPNLSITPTVQGMSIVPVDLVFEYPDHLNRKQRLTWVYRITFQNSDGFISEQTIVTLSASISSVSAIAFIYLILQPNPYEIDGVTSWLSTDLRVFQLKANESKFGVTMGSDASAFITQVISNLNSGNTGGQTFENDISTDQQVSKLELSEKINGVSVYNFAIAKVRYRALSVSATNVRVFFRTFSYATTSLNYNQATGYRRYENAGTAIPLLGIDNGLLVNIPCFAAQRVDSATSSMITQTDPANVQTIPPNASGNEVVRYFGCWLDINQTQPQFPVNPANDGPYSASSRKTIQELIRNQHQCLVSEIAFDPAPIPGGGAPSTSDKLAQRNLAIVASANPGIKASRRIPSTFEIRSAVSKIEPDELMIDWGNIPDGSLATLYIPGLSATEIIKLASVKYKWHRLARIDEHTMKCETGGLTYIPLPNIQGSFPGLLTVDLPSEIKKGQVFKIVVKQVKSDARFNVTHGDESKTTTNRWKHTIGSFQITIPVHKKEEMLEDEERLLSNLRWIKMAIPANDRWYGIFNKYVQNVANRVDDLGGNSDHVGASPSGDWQAAYRKCLGLSILLILLVIALIICIGLTPVKITALTDIPVFVIMAGIFYYWRQNCMPAICKILKVFAIGIGLGAISLSILALFGITGPFLIKTIIISFALAIILAVGAILKKCF